jgi:cephalosporin-C deacetylase-like acetyl esterase
MGCATGTAHLPLRGAEVLVFQDVEFTSQNILLRGRLYRNGKSTGLRPAVVMTHGFSATITMVVDRYAEVFAEAGFVVLLYDHAGFGRSDGEPRQVINPWVQARGYLDAVSYLGTVDGVDLSRVAVWGDSLSGGEAVVVATIDERVAAVVVQVPVCGPREAPEDPMPRCSSRSGAPCRTGTSPGPAGPALDRCPWSPLTNSAPPRCSHRSRPSAGSSNTALGTVLVGRMSQRV